MKLALLVGAVVMLAAPAAAAAAQGGALSTAQIKQRLIKQSIASYPGNCPCPYNSARNGSRCGGRSAWNRGGGYAPLCFASDVTPAMVARYRQGR
ncbi:hypothetical protein DMC47_20800 [Nostoc sp. 3335mG]|nr:hypothetical protein DMC47_20800 [Nostoc sp. 3335mG]